jgi:hypothetical protein
MKGGAVTLATSGETGVFAEDTLPEPVPSRLTTRKERPPTVLLAVDPLPPDGG